MHRVSARTLRFYEEAGLLTSCRKNTSYREYDEAQLQRLGLLVLLRRLSFGVKDIQGLLLADGADFRAVLDERLRANEAQLAALREAGGVLRALSSALADKPADALRAETLTDTLTYINQRTERMIPMNINTKAPYEEPNRIALGRDIAMNVTAENGGDLIRQIKAFRVESEAQGQVLPPVIRVYDSADLPRNQALVVWDGREVLRRAYAPGMCAAAAGEILACIRAAYRPHI